MWNVVLVLATNLHNQSQDVNLNGGHHGTRYYHHPHQACADHYVHPHHHGIPPIIQGCIWQPMRYSPGSGVRLKNYPRMTGSRFTGWMPGILIAPKDSPGWIRRMPSKGSGPSRSAPLDIFSPSRQAHWCSAITLNTAIPRASQWLTEGLFRSAVLLVS